MLVLAKGSERDEAAGSRGFLWAAARGVGADLLVVEVVAVVVVLWEDFGWRGVVNIVVGCCEGRAGMEALSCVELCCAVSVTVRGKHFPYTASGHFISRRSALSLRHHWFASPARSLNFPRRKSPSTIHSFHGDSIRSGKINLPTKGAPADGSRFISRRIVLTDDGDVGIRGSLEQ